MTILKFCLLILFSAGLMAVADLFPNDFILNIDYLFGIVFGIVCFVTLSERAN
jgi:hypothetical protein